ncbi:hypothetical protein NM688_g6629 [Phlebia brevispora]|uniref:Uncharacterized protein n=1 Tax=Phlebia brevispora TaxID=194682 RepID=A0ACC1SDZ6_9APHY|nr:hypothetical protein NM688_g6629 [Phlebia brevispora]
MVPRVVRQATSWMMSLWSRLRGKRVSAPGVRQSIKNLVTKPWFIISLSLTTAAWTIRFRFIHEGNAWAHSLIFSLCFISLIPLEIMADWGGKQMAFYLGDSLGDLLVITLHNAVEAALAILLLLKCEIRLLQSTVVGVVILHLLLVAGTVIITEGILTRSQELSLARGPVDINHGLLAVGIIAFLLLASGSQTSDGTPSYALGGDLSKLSRGISVILIIVYVISQVYMSTFLRREKVNTSSKSRTTEVHTGPKIPEIRRADDHASMELSFLHKRTKYRRSVSPGVPYEANTSNLSEDETQQLETTRPSTPLHGPPRELLPNIPTPSATSPRPHSHRWQLISQSFPSAKFTPSGTLVYSEDDGAMNLSDSDGYITPPVIDNPFSHRRLASSSSTSTSPYDTPAKPLLRRNTTSQGITVRTALQGAASSSQDPSQGHRQKPKMNPEVCMIMLIVTVALIGATAEFMIETIEHVRRPGGLSEE